ncbi:MAG: hypothetical protein M1818_004567 [Claussenomyces sp. TS43310]|nr:MAG: hypothetical protein M1818_004567 [Claussenomyces sp. TS43310]
MIPSALALEATTSPSLFALGSASLEGPQSAPGTESTETMKPNTPWPSGTPNRLTHFDRAVGDGTAPEDWETPEGFLANDSPSTICGQMQLRGGFRQDVANLGLEDFLEEYDLVSESDDEDYAIFPSSPPLFPYGPDDIDFFRYRDDRYLESSDPDSSWGDISIASEFGSPQNPDDSGPIHSQEEQFRESSDFGDFNALVSGGVGSNDDDESGDPMWRFLSPESPYSQSYENIVDWDGPARRHILESPAISPGTAQDFWQLSPETQWAFLHQRALQSHSMLDLSESGSNDDFSLALEHADYPQGLGRRNSIDIGVMQFQRDSAWSHDHLQDLASRTAGLARGEMSSDPSSDLFPSSRVRFQRHGVEERWHNEPRYACWNGKSFVVANGYDFGPRQVGDARSPSLPDAPLSSPAPSSSQDGTWDSAAISEVGSPFPTDLQLSALDEVLAYLVSLQHQRRDSAASPISEAASTLFSPALLSSIDLLASGLEATTLSTSTPLPPRALEELGIFAFGSGQPFDFTFIV